MTTYITASLIREDDDPVAEPRISLGSPRGSKDFYLVFRGEPKTVIDLLERSLPTIKEALTRGAYEDKRVNKS